MKLFHALVIAGTLIAAGNTALADSGSLNHFKPRYLPVLVQVDSKGKVTDVSPSIQLTPQFDRLLHQNLDNLITGPAIDHGRPISSQFVINLALQVSPRKEGDYLAKFAYMSISPVPSGSWYWVHVDGHRLELASRNSLDRQPRMHFNENRGNYRPSNVPHYPHAPAPAIRNAARSTPMPVSSPNPSSSRGH